VPLCESRTGKPARLGEVFGTFGNQSCTLLHLTSPAPQISMIQRIKELYNG